MATIYDPPVDTYDNTNIEIRVISNIVQFIDPKETPLLNRLGGLDAARSKFKVGENGTKIELLPSAIMVNGSVPHNASIPLGSFDQSGL